MGPDGREPSIEGRRFRLFLEQLCEERAADAHVYGVQKTVRDLLGWTDRRQQSKISQYLSETPKYASAGTVEKALAVFKKNTGLKIDHAFFKDPDLKNPRYRDYVIQDNSNVLSAAPAPPPAEPTPPQEDPVVFGLSFIAEKNANPVQVNKFLAALRQHKYLTQPTRRELELLYNVVVLGLSKSDIERDRRAEAERRAIGGERVDQKPRPYASLKPKRKSKRKPKPKAAKGKRSTR